MIEIKTYAPIFIPTLCRYEHFKRCVDSLASCTHAVNTDLIIALDYPLNESHWEGYNKIKEYLPTITGFKNVEIIERTKNWGIPKNILDGRRMTFEKYDRIIITEDDNEFSPNFLDYINKGLEKFKDDESIFAICGSSSILYKQDRALFASSFLYTATFSASGYGILRSMHEKYYFSFLNEEHHRNLLSSFRNSFKILKYLSMYISGLLSMLGKKVVYGDWSIAPSLIVKDMRCIKPVLSMVKNHGYDGSGVHCGVIDKDVIDSFEIDSASEFHFGLAPNKKDDKIALKIQKKYFKFYPLYSIWIFVRYLIYRVTKKVVFIKLPVNLMRYKKDN